MTRVTSLRMVTVSPVLWLVVMCWQLVVVRLTVRPVTMQTWMMMTTWQVGVIALIRCLIERLVVALALGKKGPVCYKALSIISLGTHGEEKIDYIHGKYIKHSWQGAAAGA